MSYSKYLYIGWYITYKPSTLTAPSSPKAVRVCSNDPKHELSYVRSHNKEKFCPECGSPIVEKTIPTTRTIGDLYHLFFENSRSEIEYGTLGRGTVEDMKVLSKGHAVFPEFMTPKHVILLPGYKKINMDSDGFVKPIEQQALTQQDHDYIELVKKVFDIRNVSHPQFGAVMEIV